MRAGIANNVYFFRTFFRRRDPRSGIFDKKPLYTQKPEEDLMGIIIEVNERFIKQHLNDCSISVI